MFACCYWISYYHLPVLSFPCPNDASLAPTNDHWWMWRTPTPTPTAHVFPRPPPTATPTARPSPASACHGRSETGGKIPVPLLHHRTRCAAPATPASRPHTRLARCVRVIWEVS